MVRGRTAVRGAAVVAIAVALSVGGALSAAAAGGTSILLVKSGGTAPLVGAGYDLEAPRLCTPGTAAGAAAAGQSAADVMLDTVGPGPVDIPEPVAPLTSNPLSPTDAATLSALVDELEIRTTAFERAFWLSVEPFLQDGGGGDVAAAITARDAALADYAAFLATILPTAEAMPGIDVDSYLPSVQTALNAVQLGAASLVGPELFGVDNPGGGGDALQYLDVNGGTFVNIAANLGVIRAGTEAWTAPEFGSNQLDIASAMAWAESNAAAIDTAYQLGYNRSYFEAIDGGTCSRSAHVVTRVNGDGTTGAHLAFELASPNSPDAQTEVRQSVPLMLTDVDGSATEIALTVTEVVAPEGFQLLGDPVTVTMGGAALDTAALSGGAAWSLSDAGGPLAVVTQIDPAVAAEAPELAASGPRGLPVWPIAAGTTALVTGFVLLIAGRRAEGGTRTHTP